MDDVVTSRQRLPEVLADQLQEEILGARLPVGHRLPTELELIERFSVSRTVVREAARLLVQRGVVTVRPGRGMAVAEFDGQFIADQYAMLMRSRAGSVEQLQELRLVLEVEMSALTATRREDSVVARLRDTIREGELSTSHRLDFLETDLAFHELIAESCGNPFFALIAGPVNAFLRRAYRDMLGYPSDPVRTLAEHRLIAAAIEAQDAAGARAAAERHLRRLLSAGKPASVRGGK